jgi:uncharacterized protein GlcG (DUF336 family)
MQVCATILAAALFAAIASEGALAQRVATPTFGSAAAMRIAQACIAYARAHNGAVNVWVYNDRGEMLHFQRMDGAPLEGPSFSAGPQYGGDPFRNGPGPVVAIPDTSPLGGVPVVIEGRTVGSVQAVGMGEEGDLACAKAAADAAKAAP